MEEHLSYQENDPLLRTDLSFQAAVVLVHYGSVDTTRHCLESLAVHENISPVFISDHGPSLPLAEQLPEFPGSMALRIQRRENLGFASGCNAAAEAAFSAGARWVWFLNNDATLDSPVLSRLLAMAQQCPQVGLWGTRQKDGEKMVDADKLPSWFPTPPYATKHVMDLPLGCRQLGARETLSGASILVSREAWIQMGPLPEWCFLYYEDVAWCLNAHELGIPMVMTDLEIRHPRNTTTGRHSLLTTYYGVRNALLLHSDLWPERKGLRLWRAVHLLQKRFLQGNWRMLAPTLRGILDARRGLRFKRP
jgi:GT2 family glycosyltransferase